MYLGLQLDEGREEEEEEKGKTETKKKITRHDYIMGKVKNG